LMCRRISGSTLRVRVSLSEGSLVQWVGSTSGVAFSYVTSS
jgi:hypothetical protein